MVCKEVSSPQVVVSRVQDSLDVLLGRVERGEGLLGTARSLLTDYCYTNTGMKDTPVKYPKEIELAMSIISLVIDDIKTECDVIADNIKELETAL